MGAEHALLKTIEENTFYYAVQLEDGRILRLGSTQRNLFGLLFGMTGMILIAIALTLAVAAFLAGRMTKSIVQPINDLNLEDPENSKVYDELVAAASAAFPAERSDRAQLKRALPQAAGVQRHYR